MCTCLIGCFYLLGMLFLLIDHCFLSILDVQILAQMVPPWIGWYWWTGTDGLVPSGWVVTQPEVNI